MRIEHILPPDLLRHRAVRVLVVGAGGTGSAIIMGLPYLDQAMRAWGHRYGLEVALMDADQVSETNCVRQPFSISDIGQNKATVLINRINLFWGRTGRRSPLIFMLAPSTATRTGAPTLSLGVWTPAPPARQSRIRSHAP